MPGSFVPVGGAIDGGQLASPSAVEALRPLQATNSNGQISCENCRWVLRCESIRWPAPTHARAVQFDARSFHTSILKNRVAGDSFPRSPSSS